MGVLGKLRGFVPPSSRSFHQLFEEVIGFRAEMRGYFADTRNRLDELARLQGEMAQLRADVDGARREARAHDAHLKLFMWQLYSREGEEYDDARKRFFLSLPKATGELRLLQMASARLLRDFGEFCEEHGLDYWMVSGTLLGAYRHGGFIPWDDDIDVGMLRPDVEKLLEVAAEDSRFQVTEVFDRYVHCRQVRFRYRDELVPCFLDVFIFDLSSLPPQEAHASMLEHRRAMIEAMDADGDLAFWNESNLLVDADSDEGALIGARFEEAVKSLRADEERLADGASTARSVVWGLDNLDSLTGRPIVSSYDAVFPTSSLSFEGASLSAPNDPPVVLDAIFGDYLDLPGDIVAHFEHVPREQLRDERVAAAMKRCAGL